MTPLNRIQRIIEILNVLSNPDASDDEIRTCRSELVRHMDFFEKKEKKKPTQAQLNYRQLWQNAERNIAMLEAEIEELRLELDMRESSVDPLAEAKARLRRKQYEA